MTMIEHSSVVIAYNEENKTREVKTENLFDYKKKIIYVYI